MDRWNEGSWDKDPGRYGRYITIEGWVYTRPSKAELDDVLLSVP